MGDAEKIYQSTRRYQFLLSLLVAVASFFVFSSVVYCDVSTACQENYPFKNVFCGGPHLLCPREKNCVFFDILNGSLLENNFQ